MDVAAPALTSTMRVEAHRQWLTSILLRDAAVYAEKTAVPVERSRAEIERLLQKHRAMQYLTAVDHEGNRAIVQFKMCNRIVKFEVGLPARPKDSASRSVREYEQAGRQRWRALLLVLKAKLEAIENRISTFDSEFLSHIVMPDGQTVGEYVVPQIEAAYASGKGVLMLPQSTAAPSGH
jgi:hypothetical protein